MAAWLIDTNILVYLVNTAAAEHASARLAMARLLETGARMVLAAQVIYEFWAVVTRPPSANGLGWTAGQALSSIEKLRERFEILPETEAVLDLWLQIAAQHQLTGKRVHDAHLLATMRAHGVERIVTFNTQDFPVVPGIEILTPDSVWP